MRKMMQYLITLFLLIPSALNAMDQAPSAPNPKPVEIDIYPVFGHVRADKGDRTIHSTCISSNGNPEGRSPFNFNSTSYYRTKLTLTEIIPNDAAQQLTVLFSLMPYKDKPAYQGLVIAQYGSRIPLGDGESDVRYTLCIPSYNRVLDQCDCPTQEHKNDLAAALAWVLAQPPAESNSKKLSLATESLAQLTITPNDQGDDAMKERKCEIL